MAGRKKLFTSAFIGATISVFMVLCVRRNGSEPGYKGKPLSFWFREYCLAWPNASGAPEPITDAIRAMGSDAVPYLVRELLGTNQDSGIRKWYVRLADSLPLALQRGLPRSISADQRRDKAGDALFYSKPSAYVLLPLLTNALDSPDVTQRRRALFVLGGAGNGARSAVPYLVAALKDPDTMARSIAAQSLKLLRAEAAPAVPELIEALNDPRIRWNAAAALGNAGSNGKSALPALNRLLDTGSNRDRLNIAAAIYKLDPAQSAAFAIIIDALKQKNDPKLRKDAAWTLRAMGPVARDAVPDLVKTVKDQNIEVWTTALDALKRITTDNRAAIPALLEKLNSPQAGDRINAAAWLVRIDPNEPHGLAVLTEYIQSGAGAGDRYFAIDVLAEAGAGAKAAIPVLKAVSKDKDKEVRKHAIEALKKIEFPAAK